MNRHLFAILNAIFWDEASEHVSKSNITDLVPISIITSIDVDHFPDSNLTNKNDTTESVSEPTSVSDFIVFAAGDICGERRFSPGCKETGQIILSESTSNPLVLALGDLAYENGTISEFSKGYDPHWGMFKNNTYPILGNHEALDDYRGYFEYWGNGSRTQAPGSSLKYEGFYSFNVGESWHLVAINTDKWKSNQEQWLRDDLLMTPRNKCILVFGHKPRYSPGKYGPAGTGVPSKMENIFNILVEYNVDLYLAGHDHIYARHSKQDGAGNAFVNGTAHFLVGTGGINMQPIYDRNMTNLESSFTSAVGSIPSKVGPFGVLRLVLKDGSYDFSYLVTDGDFKDSGSTECNV